MGEEEREREREGGAEVSAEFEDPGARTERPRR